MLDVKASRCCNPAPARWVGRLVFVAVVLGLFVSPVSAQRAASEKASEKTDAKAKAPAKAAEKPAAKVAPKPFVQLPVDKARKSNRTKISKILRSGKFGAGEEAFFVKYYQTYALARWATQSEYNQLPARRKELQNDLTTAKQGAAHDRLNALALEFLGKMVNANMHPAVRFNAMLAIGELNSREPTFRDPPVPWSETLPVLLNAFNDEKQIDAVRLAALVGLSRWASLGIPEGNARNQVLEAVLKTATTRSVPGRSVAGQAWMRCRAIEVLGKLGTVGNDGAVAKALARILKQENTPISVRMAAARALGKLDYGQESGLAAPEVVSGLGELAAEACTQELARMKKEIERRKREALDMGFGGRRGGARGRMPMGEGGMLMGGPGLGPMAGSPDDEEESDRVSRRRLKAWLAAVRTGLVGEEDKPGGITSLAKSSEDQKFAAAVTKPIDTWISLLGDKELDDEKLVAALEESLNTFEKLLQAAPAPEEEKEEKSTK